MNTVLDEYYHSNVVMGVKFASVCAHVFVYVSILISYSVVKNI